MTTTTEQTIETNVVVWSRKDGECVKCIATERRLNQKNVPHITYYLEDHPEKVEEFRAQGLVSAPVVVTPDDIWCGYRPDRIDAFAAALAAGKTPAHPSNLL